MRLIGVDGVSLNGAAALGAKTPDAARPSLGGQDLLKGRNGQSTVRQLNGARLCLVAIRLVSYRH